MKKVHHQTVCASAVLAFFKVRGVTWNDRIRQNVWDGTLRRNGFSLRSRFSKLTKKERSVGGSRSKLADIASKESLLLAFIVAVPGHVMVLSRQGDTVVDTSPRERDRRQIKRLLAVFRS